MKPILTTERLNFYQFLPTDGYLIKDLDSDPEVMRYLTDGKASDDAEVERIMKILMGHYEKFGEEFGVWKAYLDQDFIGWFHYRPLKANPDDISQIELGYRLKQKYWGQGFATEGSIALVKKAKNDPRIKALWASAMKGNSASQNVMEKVGMSFHSDWILESWPGEDKRAVWFKLDL
ncbi:MAG: GNAT family N-acetyltransferase [Halobacteriovoraceae bacterium]|nr:GNAT family N-acetyltransferase [Halobacteriovoraceae bacterium]|tara:strand:- start:6490 stop:7020 length:531 start_codon:yes stop_codon:yes gene_type:complete